MNNFQYPYRALEADGLQKQLWLSENVSSRLSVVVAGHSMGKTDTVLEALKDSPTVYLPLGGKLDILALEDYKANCAEALGIFVPRTISSFTDLFNFLCDLAWDRSFSVVLDNYHLAPARFPEFCAHLAKKWKQDAKKTKMNLVLVCEEEVETPQPDATFVMKPLSVSMLKELQDSAAPAGSPALKPEDYLAFYLFTAGRPDAVRCCLANKAITQKALLQLMQAPYSPLAHLAEASVYGLLGKNSDTYLSILQLIASGVKSQAEMEQRLGGIIIGGHLAKLENEYKIIRKSRPLLSTPDSRGVVRYHFTDSLLALWFRLVFTKLGYEAFLQEELRDYLVEKFTRENLFTSVGAQWEASARISRKGALLAAEEESAPRQGGVDLVALKGKKAMLAAVCIRADDFLKEPFLKQVEALKKGVLKGYTIDARLFTLADV